MFNHCAVFICSAVVCYSSEDFSWCLSNVGDALICWAGVLINKICVKYFRAFTFVAGVGRFNNNVVFSEYGCYLFLECYWTTTNVNCCKIRTILISVFFSYFVLKLLFCLAVELSVLWISKNLLVSDYIRFF